MNYGTKADNLALIRKLHPNHVPPFEATLFSEIIVNYPATIKRVNRFVSSTLSHQTNQKNIRLQIDKIMQSVKLENTKIESLHKDISKKKWRKISIRTSALSEDSEFHSFAGQYLSFIDVTPSRSNLEKYILKSFKSLFSEPVLAYARSHGFNKIDVGGSVIVQEMFYGTRSGVLFTEDGQGNVVLSFTDSWRNTVVEGDSATTISVQRTSLNSKDMTPLLRSTVKTGLELEKHMGAALDIEWSYDKHTFMLLQARPQSTDTRNYSVIWDATNISENYPGITLPLTYSFIKNLYANVYPSFFGLLGMSAKKLQQNYNIFDNTLGYINGKVYYRINNWYEIVKLLPGSHNQEFFEAMLDPVKKRGNRQPNRRPRLPKMNFRMVLMSMRFFWLLLRSRSYSKKFTKNFSAIYQEIDKLNWAAMSAEACLNHLHSIRQRLLVQWGIPILNDVRVMIFHGIYKTIIMKDANRKVYLESLSGLRDRASIKPLEALAQLGNKINIALKRANTTRLDDLKTTSSWTDIEKDARHFIDAFGGRTPDELQLENPRLSENIFDIISLAYASKDASLKLHKKKNSYFRHLPVHKKFFANIVAKNMRSAIDYRERFRFNRAQIFGIGRTVYLEIGKKFVIANVITDENDIFWLTEQEIEAVVRGHSWEYSLKETVVRRKTLYKSYEIEPLRLHVTGEGIIAPKTTINSTPPQNSQSITGAGVAPGNIKAEAIVVHKFEPTLDVAGKILVVKHVDPGWTLLLVQAAGVISEQGNPLSHVAIVSREISIPAIVGITGAVKLFKSGETISIDGTTGEVVRDT